MPSSPAPAAPAVSPRPSGARQLTSVPIGHLVPNPFQSRIVLDDEDLAALAESIRRYGFMGHIEVRHDPVDRTRPLQIVFGHRRVEAAKRAGLATVPVAIIERSDEQTRRITFVENAARRGLSYWEEAVFLGTMKRELNLTVRQIADELGISRSYVQERLDLLKIPNGPLRDAAQKDEIGFSTAWYLMQMPADARDELLDQVRAGTLNVNGLRMLRRAHARRQEQLEHDSDPGGDETTPKVPSYAPARLGWTEPPSPFTDAANRAATARPSIPTVSTSRPQPGTSPPRPDGSRRSDADVRSMPTPLSEGTLWYVERTDADRPAPTVPVAPIAVTAPVPSPIVFDRTMIRQRSGHDFAVLAIEQIEANAHHLRLKLERADFALLSADEHARLGQAKTELAGILASLP
jgi:ParB/RepB/Spo0J family partition protein